METLKCWSSLNVMILFLATVSKACEAPSSPQCYRKNAGDSVYMCEWSMNTTESNVTFNIYFNKNTFGGIKTTWCQINEERLIKYRPVDIWVEAHVGNSSCASSTRSVVLADTVKYEAPQNISVSWLKNNLSLTWTAAEKHPAAAEVRLRRDEQPAEPWEKRLTNTTNNTSIYQVIVMNLLKHSAYQVQIRHRSTQATNPLWSEWSTVVLVPAELEHEPEVTVTTKHLNGTRMLRLTWKPMSHSAAVRGVTYSLRNTQSPHGCPCMKKKPFIIKDKHTTYMYVSYSAVNISVTARNAVGNSPPAIVQVPTKPPTDLKACDKMLLENLTRKSCHEWYELKDADRKPENVITLTRKKKEKQRKELIKKMKDYVRYLYFEHRCYNRKPHTVQMCLFYRKEGAPNSPPQHFRAFAETPTSANLLWKAIPLVNQRGHLINYTLCCMKISTQVEREECRNISASLEKYHLENLTSGSKYNLSLAGVTHMGEGPKITTTITTLPEKPVKVWLSFGLLFVFFIISTLCTVILKRIQNKIFPPVPTPVIADFNACQPESQEILEEKEEVHELTLLQLHPEVKSSLGDAGECTVLRGDWDDGNDEDMENERGDLRMSGETSDESPGSTDQTLRSCREGEITDLDQVENEIAMLIYRNGLVFDLKTDSA
ncbi:interleukin-12 receptor subunit beta-1 [Anabas testudineus]|uniref:Fibronectin type-III domain-containing protein n=1 Tax=Anabas testudineus TaxID=64144 RepID=A0A3Q1JYR0_ANATE|nr:interleukin-12 receptor subunit beta-1 [Anabas testudineus]